MKRIVVIGSGGSGKSTFSRQLGGGLGIEVIHLDAMFWRPGWAPTPKDEWAERVRELCERDSWIMDGNFGGTRELRFAACDTIIFLDMPRRLCLYRVIKRFIKYRGGNRPDMAAGCNEKLDLEFLAWVWNYPKKGRINALADLERCRDKHVVILRSKREADTFLKSL
jgi:adenylate kinase family enzyme